MVKTAQQLVLIVLPPGKRTIVDSLNSLPLQEGAGQHSLGEARRLCIVPGQAELELQPPGTAGQN
jgi:hypothetical protein